MTVTPTMFVNVCMLVWNTNIVVINTALYCTKINACSMKATSCISLGATFTLIVNQ